MIFRYFITYFLLRIFYCALFIMHFVPNFSLIQGYLCTFMAVGHNIVHNVNKGSPLNLAENICSNFY